MRYIRIRSLQQYLIRTISTSRAFSVFSDAEYPDIEFARARRYLLGKVGRVGRVFGSVICVYVHVPYFTLSKGEVTYYMYLHASS